ncbi:MAG: hypothetical protein AAGA48_23875 [Myxococcota bacterium]
MKMQVQMTAMALLIASGCGTTERLTSLVEDPIRSAMAWEAPDELQPWVDEGIARSEAAAELFYLPLSEDHITYGHDETMREALWAALEGSGVLTPDHAFETAGFGLEDILDPAIREAMEHAEILMSNWIASGLELVGEEIWAVQGEPTAPSGPGPQGYLGWMDRPGDSMMNTWLIPGFGLDGIASSEPFYMRDTYTDTQGRSVEHILWSSEGATVRVVSITTTYTFEGEPRTLTVTRIEVQTPNGEVFRGGDTVARDPDGNEVYRAPSEHGDGPLTAPNRQHNDEGRNPQPYDHENIEVLPDTEREMGGCPLVFPHCRKLWNDLQTSGNASNIGLKHAKVRVGNWDDQQVSNGPRLNFDWGSIVINPDPDALEGEQGNPENVRVEIDMKMLVNPPGGPDGVDGFMALLEGSN